MNLTIQLYNQTVCHVDVNYNARVIDVIKQIHTTLACPHRSWHLRFNNNVLNFMHTLTECNISDGCTLTIVYRIRIFVVGDSHSQVRNLLYAYTRPNLNPEYYPVSFETAETTSLNNGQAVEITWTCSADLQVSFFVNMLATRSPSVICFTLRYYTAYHFYLLFLSYHILYHILCVRSIHRSGNLSTMAQICLLLHFRHSHLVHSLMLRTSGHQNY
jgi:hypothetical protein